LNYDKYWKKLLTLNGLVDNLNLLLIAKNNKAALFEGAALKNLN
jgi:hypothetical protein